MKQIALDIGLHTEPTLTNFFAGSNIAAVQHLNLWVSSPTRSPVPTYLWGSSSSGKTHLLKGVAHALREQGVRVGWLDASMHQLPLFDEAWSAVLMDDVHLYTALQQHAAFNLVCQRHVTQLRAAALGAGSGRNPTGRPEIA